jgi:ribosomal-protein-alanine N-acetyltransferase
VSALFLTPDESDAIDTERLRLRAPSRAHVGPLDAAIQETLPELVRWLPWARRGHSRADSRFYVQSARHARARRLAFEFVIELADSGLVLGMTSLHRVDWHRRTAGLGYWIRRSHWNQGIAAEAAMATLEQAFRHHRLHRVEAHVAVENHGSHRVVEKLGFRREGVARAYELVDGHYLDHVQYSLLSTDFERARP